MSIAKAFTNWGRVISILSLLPAIFSASQLAAATNNIPLTVSFYYPTNGQTYTAPTNVIMHALVLDSAVVNTVQYFAGDTSLGTKTNTANQVFTNSKAGNPFALVWSNVPPGSYQLTAVATDTNGVVVTSAPVNITVAGVSHAPVPLTVRFYYPTNGQTFAAPADIGVHAEVLDSNIVDTVRYYANGASIGTRTNSGQILLTNSTTLNPFFLDWSNVVAGKYALTAVATDSAHNVVTSAPVNIIVSGTTVSPTNKAALTLLVSGNGRITGETNGAVLVFGKTYTLGAVPAANWVFAGWEMGTNTNTLSSLTNGPTLPFVMVSNLVIEATFVTNPFPAVAGTYNGLFMPATGATENSSGFVTITIPSSSHGSYSAKLLLGGQSISFTGTFDLTGTSQKTINRTGRSPLTVTLKVNLKGGSGEIAGIVAGSDTNPWSSDLQADRCFFNSTTAQATSIAGKYTLLVPPGDLAPTNQPGGYGFLALSVNIAGRATIAGQLADGTSVSQSVPVSSLGWIPAYMSLYSGQGLLIGWMNVAHNVITQPPQTISATNMAWIKPSGNSTVYPAGFSENSIDMPGSSYAAPANGGNVLSLTNGTLTISNANLGVNLVFSNMAVVGSKLVNLNTNDNPTNYLYGYFVPGTGTMTLSFRPTGAPNNSYAKGAVLQNSMPPGAAGWYIDANRNSQSFILSQ